MSTNTPAAGAARAPRKFDNFQERVNGRKPASAATAPKAPAPSVATAPAQATLAERLHGAWQKQQQREMFAKIHADSIEREAKGTVEVATEAAATARTSAQRWDQANAKVQSSVAPARRSKDAAGKSSADRWERANAKIENQERTHA